MAKKELKKKNIRLRKRIRKTLGAACLITALLVAAIPVPEVKADTTDVKLTWDNTIWNNGGTANKSAIPVVPADCDTIYTTRDGTFQFAFVPSSATSTEMIAVILGYTAGTLSEDSQGRNVLEIPDTVEAFTKFSENEGSRTGYVAVSYSHKPLYYMSAKAVYKQVLKVNDSGEPILDTEGNQIWETALDEHGNPIILEEAKYLPCYNTDYNSWCNLDLGSFYYLDKNGKYQLTTDDSEKWIKNITVAYIGNQSLQRNDAVAGVDGAVQEWKIVEADGKINTNPDEGVFAGESNIESLIVGNSLMGIGNYAFYNCTNLESIKLGNGLTEIGKYAFANCVNMKEIDMDLSSRLTYISDYTFQNCRAMTTFVLPSSVRAIYDGAFAGCTDLGNKAKDGYLDLSGATEDKNVNLQEMGYHIFSGCTSLEELTLPDSIENSKNTINLNNFAGCSKLKHITVDSPYTVIEDSNSASYKGTGVYTSANFLTDVDATFYFEGVGSAAVHTFTQEHAIAFKYADKDCYEIIVVEDAVGGGTAKLTYQVNSHNELLFFNMSDKVEEVTIPASIGPYGISAINSGSFSGNCFLKKITIPATVSVINDGAFKGCHNLEHVIFANADGITYIGKDAFATQVVTLHSSSCPNPDFLDSTSNNFVVTPSLTFTGTVGSDVVPYAYAMNAANTINAGAQTRTYITYYSGWPTNLEIQYVVDEETGKGAATLVDYPTYSELSSGKYSKTNYPYITDAFELAAKNALAEYVKPLTDPTRKLTADQQQIIDAALKVTIPSGVNAIADGLFSGVKGVKNADGTYTVQTVSGQSADTAIQEITLTDVTEIEPYTFSGCKSLATINITGGADKIDDYAFAYAYTVPDKESGSESALVNFNMTGGGGTISDYAFCNNALLTNVTISPSVNEIGIRPFKDCPMLSGVNFNGSSYFTTDAAIIYGLENGAKASIVQCLESRGALNTNGSVSAKELSGVSSIAPEAFMDCESIGSVDLSSTNVKNIPQSAFENTKSLYQATIPTSCTSISKEAFWDSNIRYITIPSSVTFIDPYAFTTNKNTSANLTPYGYNTIEFYCEEGSAAVTYANEYDSITITDKPLSTTFKVIFWGMDGSIIEEQEVLIGTDAVAPEAPEVEGYRFTGWSPSDFTKVSRNMDITAQYEKKDSDEYKYTVRFFDWDGTEIADPQRVEKGGNAISPIEPTREGYRFTGWYPALTNITKDTDAVAQYEWIDSEEKKYTVRFFDYDGVTEVAQSQKVSPGGDAIEPIPPTREGYKFTGWWPAITKVTQNIDTMAQYEKIDSADLKYTVRFIDWDDTVLYTQSVAEGQDAITPLSPTREGYTFTGWRPGITGITKDTDVYAQYEKTGSSVTTPTPTPGNNGGGSGSGGGTGTTTPAPTATPTPGPGSTTTPAHQGTATPTPAPTAPTLYTLTVRDGSGSGSYAAGATVIIVADEAPSGKEFSKWTTDNTSIAFASTTVGATTLTMPAANATVQANFTAKSTSGSGSGSGNSGSNGSGSNNTTGSTVVIDKNGLSNTGVVSVTIKGSSDNFVLKVTDSSSASEAIVEALLDEYGSLDDIKYFPMDISLYDSTGKNKITDTSGLSISITLPLPDSMIKYAGNNKVAGVVNDKLDKLTPKFTTIDGVSCITFTAEHFSPYVIYVDTSRLESVGVVDDTPKTGDIHPKWFAVIGLTCVAVVLFAKKDKTGKQVVHA